MTKFHPRYVEVEAMQFDGANFNEIYSFAGENVTLLGSSGDWQQINVHTNNGTVQLLPGHWLISGEYDFYPCDPDTFKSRWVPIDSEDAGVAFPVQELKKDSHWDPDHPADGGE